MVVHRSADKPFADVNPLGVVVRSVRPLDPGASFALHSGFLYRLDDGEPRIQHLAFHLELEDEPAAAPYLWADVGLDEGNSRVVAAWLAVRGAMPQDIPYGLDSAGSCFDDQTLAYIPDGAGKGLTCATYVKAVLKQLGFDLLREDTWPSDRPEDHSWQAAVIGALVAEGASDEHIAGVIGDVGAKRFVPAEVVGAATRGSATWPVSFDDVAAVAANIVDDVRAALKAPGR